MHVEYDEFCKILDDTVNHHIEWDTAKARITDIKNEIITLNAEMETLQDKNDAKVMYQTKIQTYCDELIQSKLNEIEH